MSQDNRIIKLPAHPVVQSDEQWTDESGFIRNVSQPTLTVFPPTSGSSNGIGVLVCPGGGYVILDWEAHVTRLAAFLNPLGFTVFGLGYRTSPPSTQTPHEALEDLDNALREIQRNAGDWGIDTQKIVGLGFSAGANLLLQSICHHRADAPLRLNYLALLCLWPFDKTPEDYSLSNVPSKVWLCSTRDDKIAPIAFSEAIADRLKEEGADVTLKAYDSGDHIAFNFEPDGPRVDWTKDFLDWLSDCHLI